MHCNRRSDRAGNHAAHRQPGAVSEYGGLRHARARTAWRDHSLRVGQIPLESKARIAVIDTISRRAQRSAFLTHRAVHGTFFESVCAPQQIAPTHFRFGSKADIRACPINVRFTPKSGRSSSALGCLLCATNRHFASLSSLPTQAVLLARHIPAHC